MKRQVSARGFTLIEIMIVVAIIAVIASMATPTFTRLTLRSKAAERHEVMQRIKKAVGDFYVQNGSTIPKGETEPLSSETEQPPLPATTGKRMPDWGAKGWAQLFRSTEEIMGALYYSYSFACTEASGADPARLTITAVGDLDGDGIPSEKELVYTRVNGVYQLESEDPPPGAEYSESF